MNAYKYVVCSLNIECVVNWNKSVGSNNKQCAAGHGNEGSKQGPLDHKLGALTMLWLNVNFIVKNHIFILRLFEAKVEMIY